VAVREIAMQWWALVDAERQSLALWLPVAFAIGVGLWFGLPWQAQRLAVAVALAGIGAAAWAGRWRPLAIVAVMALAGMAAAEWRSARVAAPVMKTRGVHLVAGAVSAVENRSDRDQMRVLVAPDPGDLPPLIRLTVRAGLPDGVVPGARIRVRAMLSPPAGAAVPGGYDFARRAWFAGIGATGFPFGPMVMTAPAPPPDGVLAVIAAFRSKLTARISAAVPGAAGAVAAAFVTGDQGLIPLITAQAMRDSGLAHLLSISGLHIAVVVGGTIFLVRRGLALFPWVALRWPVKAIAVAVAAVLGVAYTVLAGAEVPTVRTIIATLIVLFGMIIGREAFSLRLLAAAAVIILAVRPEALLGASFQLSFAAVIAIVALYESPLGRRLTTPVEDEGAARWLARQAAALLVTGLVAEMALSSIGLFHFNRAGLYGVFANMVAIPWTSLVVMPALMLALLAEVLGVGALLWPLVGWAMGWLIALAEMTAALPGAVVRQAAVPVPAFAAIIAGGLWVALWRSRLRWWGVVPVALGLVLTIVAPRADVLISSDGRHAAVRLEDGRLAFLRDRTGAFLRSVWGDALAADGEARFTELPGMACSRDACVAVIRRGGRAWRLLATVSRDYIDRVDFEPACAAADIVVSDRRMPRWCRPRWQMFDRERLAMTGAVALWLVPGRVVTANDRIGDHPWRPGQPSAIGKGP
jgi:competence protein ComEC